MGKFQGLEFAGAGTDHAGEVHALVFPLVRDSELPGEARGKSIFKGKDSISKKGKLRVMDKELVLDLIILGIKLDNIEGMTFGPSLPSGERSLILVSDNNFNPFQFIQFPAFALEE